MAKLLILVLAAGGLARSICAAESKLEPIVSWVADPAHSDQWRVEVSGIGPSTLEALRGVKWDAADWQKLLPVHVEHSSLLDDIGLPAMLGDYRVVSNGIWFVPQFPLDPDINYRATLWPQRLPGNGGAQNKPISARFIIPAGKAMAPTVVSQVYPTATVLPENLLKFYVHFSAPMSRGHIYDYIHLRNDAGKHVELPFLELDEELWNPPMTRLILFIDPGRIKRGVTPLEEVGPALEEGKRFTLVIDSQWRDSHGRPLKESYHKTFNVGPADRDPPDPARWRIQAPNAKTGSALTVNFNEPMDHALAQRIMRVVDDAGNQMAGRAELEEYEQRWTFIPQDSWISGRYKILVQTTIEDLAGNNIGKRFEVDVFDGVQRRFTNSTVALPFRVN